MLRSTLAVAALLVATLLSALLGGAARTPRAGRPGTGGDPQGIPERQDLDGGAPAREIPPADASQIAELLRLLDSDTPRKDRIVRRIAEANGEAAWEGLIARLADPLLRAAIEVALGRSAPPEVIDELKRRLLRCADGELRASLLRVLAETGDPRHGEDVRALLERETDAEARRAAIGALGRFGDAASADALLDLTRRGGGEARTARLALDDVGDAQTLRHAALRWPELDSDTRLALLHAARESEAASLVTVAKTALVDPDERVRIESLRLLARAGDAAVEPLLDHALRGEETEQALRALSGIGTEKAAEAGLRALDGLSPRRQEWYRALFLATLCR